MVSLPKSVAERIVRQIRFAIVSAMPDGGEVSVAYSGGIDSTVLLGLSRMHKIANVRLSAVHVNHHLHPHANKWAEHCRRRCLRWEVPLAVMDVQVDKRKQGQENRARQARLDALRRLPVDAVLMAHHADDQAETLLLRALRGSGVRGLSAMRELSTLQGSDKMLLRPLLPYTKADLQQAARHLRVRGISDPSNRDTSHNRNWLRHAVLPEASRRFPGAIAALNTVARNIQKDASLLADLAQLDEMAAATTDGGVSRAYFADLGHKRVANWLAWQVAARGKQALTGRHLREAARQICDTKKEFDLEIDGLVLICRKGKITWSDCANKHQSLLLGKITATPKSLAESDC